MEIPKTISVDDVLKYVEKNGALKLGESLGTIFTTFPFSAYTKPPLAGLVELFSSLEDDPVGLSIISPFFFRICSRYKARYSADVERCLNLFKVFFSDVPIPDLDLDINSPEIPLGIPIVFSDRPRSKINTLDVCPLGTNRGFKN